MEYNFYYCERTNLDFFSEPLNFFTNFAFIYCSIILFLDKRVLDKRYTYIMFCIGVGSLLFHSVPNYITGLLDVFFIMLFIFYYLKNLYFALKINIYFSYLLSIIFIFFCYFFGQYFSGTYLSSSAYYFPILMHLYFLYFYFLFQKKNYYYHKRFINIPIIFSISLFLRTIDYHSCSLLLTGTHFIWHILNAIVLYLLIKFIHLISYRTSPKEPT